MTRWIPMLFSAPMVVALLHGRKTVTRRLSTKAVAGDRIWGRETLREARDGWTYAADGAPVMVANRNFAACLSWAHHKETETCVSIHMPRWASRITLEVLSVREERLHAIDGEDAEAEGIARAPNQCPCEVCGRTGAMCPATASGMIDEYARLWDGLNAKKAPWKSNPLVHRIEFRRVPQEAA